MENLEYIDVIVVIGFVLMAASLLYKRLENAYISLPMVLVLIGMLIGWLTPYITGMLPQENGKAAEHLTELAVTISLVGAGLKIDRDMGWKSWRITWRLLAIAMPLSIVALALGGYFYMGLSVAASILLGGTMAPTDPVLASSVQVGAPGQGQEDNVRFGLTSEAGLNDGLAFPFIHLAILLSATGKPINLAEWISVYVLWKTLAGLVIGWAVGRMIGYLTFKFNREDVVSDGLMAIALTLISYSLSEFVQGYGFISVFIAAYTFRRYEKDHDYHEDLHNFSEQIERILLAIVMLIFGVLIAQGMLSALTWEGVVTSLVFLLVIRPVSAYLCLDKLHLKPFRRFAISYLGIRGIGSFYYIAYAFEHSTGFKDGEVSEIWATVGFIVLTSIFLHGVTAPFFMNKIGQPATDSHKTA